MAVVVTIVEAIVIAITTNTPKTTVKAVVVATTMVMPKAMVKDVAADTMVNTKHNQSNLSK